MLSAEAKISIVVIVLVGYKPHFREWGLNEWVYCTVYDEAKELKRLLVIG